MEFDGRKITRKALGRTTSIGSLYSIVDDQLYSSSCFTSNIPERHILTQDTPNVTQTIYFGCDSFIKSFFNVNQGMSVLFELCKEQATYLLSFDDAFIESQATILREYRSKETFLRFSEDLSKLINFETISTSDATHVIIGIKWGSTIIVNLKRPHSSDEEKDRENLYKWFMSDTTDDTLEKEATLYAVTYSGDLLNKSFTSQSIQEVIIMLGDISLKCTTTTKQSEYILCPIKDIAKYFNQTIKINKIFQELQEPELSPLLGNSIHVFYSFAKVNRHLMDNLIDKVNKLAEFTHPKDSILVQEKHEALRNAKMMFIFEVADMIIEVRSGSENEEKLFKFIYNFDCKNFSETEKTQKWLEGNAHLSTKLDYIERIRSEKNMCILKNTASIEEILKENQYSCVWYGSEVTEEWTQHYDEFIELRNYMMHLYLETSPDICQRFFIINSSDILHFNPHAGPLIHLYYSTILVTDDLYTLTKRNILVSISLEENGAKMNTKTEVNLSTTISQIIADSCVKLDCGSPDYHFLTVDNIFVEKSLPVDKTNICLSSSIKRLHKKSILHLRNNKQYGNKILFVTDEQLQATDIMDIQIPFNTKQIIPDSLMESYYDIQRHKKDFSDRQLTVLPLPVFNHTIIDDLPRICLTIPLNSDEFNWPTLLDHLSHDLEVNVDQLIVVNVERGSTKLELILAPKNDSPSEFKEKISKIKAKMPVFLLDKQSNVQKYLEYEMKKPIDTICAELKNFSSNDQNYLSLINSDVLSVFLSLHERPAIISEEAWNYLIEKSREINVFITHSFNHRSFNEYIINSIALIYNQQLYESFEKSLSSNQKILFHGTSDLQNIDGIFENNYHFSGKTDSGWYGKGIYFTSSPRYALRYARKSPNHAPIGEISFIICNIVSLGKMLQVTNIDDYHGKEMNPSYDSHYVRVGIERNIPVTDDVSEYYEEYVVKCQTQALPLYVIGVYRVNKLVIWRDAKIKNQSNSNLFNNLKERVSFNIYGCETSTEAIELLKEKLPQNEFGEQMRVRVVTNGADDGQQFVEACRKWRNNLPIIVYCMNFQYHMTWASLFRPIVNVTITKDEVFEFIRELEQE